MPVRSLLQESFVDIPIGTVPSASVRMQSPSPQKMVTRSSKDGIAAYGTE